MHGPPGTGKTLMARACAAQTQATFLKLAGPQLVQMFIGDGAKMVRDAFELAKEKSPAIIFEESCTFSGAIYRLVGGTWEEYLVLDEVLGHSESVDTWWGDAALGKMEPTPG